MGTLPGSWRPGAPSGAEGASPRTGSYRSHQPHLPHPHQPTCPSPPACDGARRRGNGVRMCVHACILGEGASSGRRPEPETWDAPPPPPPAAAPGSCTVPRLDVLRRLARRLQQARPEGRVGVLLGNGQRDGAVGGQLCACELGRGGGLWAASGGQALPPASAGITAPSGAPSSPLLEATEAGSKLPAAVSPSPLLHTRTTHPPP